MSSAARLLHPALNPTGLMAAAGVIYAGTSMIYNVVNHHGAWSTPVFIALVGAVSSLLARQVVTPVADPVDGAGRPLVPAAAAAPPEGITVTVPPQPVGVPHVIIEDAAPPGEAQP